MIEEYKKSEHYKKKVENFKINKIMGRIRKKAKGPNPLSCKKKKDDAYKDKNDNIKFPSENKNLKNNSENFNNINNIQIQELSKTADEETNQEFLKKKRKRKRKNKNE